jgi:hypothetical protein
MRNSFFRKSVSSAFATLTALVSCVTLASHTPPSTEVIVYDAALANAQVYNGAISYTAQPNNGYDWFCVTGIAGTEISATMTRTSGDLLPNLGFYSGTVASGTTVSAAISLVDEGDSSNSSSNTVNLAFTPSANGLVTVRTSTWTGESGGYTLSVTGVGAAPLSCARASAAGPTSVPTLNGLNLVLLALLLGAAAAIGTRFAWRRQ